MYSSYIVCRIDIALSAWTAALCQIIADDNSPTGISLENVGQGVVAGCSGGSGEAAFDPSSRNITHHNQIRLGSSHDAMDRLRAPVRPHLIMCNPNTSVITAQFARTCVCVLQTSPRGQIAMSTCGKCRRLGMMVPMIFSQPVSALIKSAELT